jgi:hypothetical protein
MKQYQESVLNFLKSKNSKTRVVAGKGTESQSEAFFSLLSGLKAAFWSA